MALHIKIRAYKNFADFVKEQASQQIDSLKKDITEFKRMLNGKMSDQEREWLNDAIEEKKAMLSRQQAMLKKYQKVR